MAEQGPPERSVPVNHDSSRLAKPVGACLCLQISVRIPALVAVRDQTQPLSFSVNVFVQLTTISQLGVQLATSQSKSHRSLQHWLIGQPQQTGESYEVRAWREFIFGSLMIARLHDVKMDKRCNTRIPCLRCLV